jgi:hypothetical protein
VSITSVLGAGWMILSFIVGILSFAFPMSEQAY